jgi:DUF1126 PH-like domain
VQTYTVGVRPRSAQSRGATSTEYYRWQDLAVGGTVLIFGREMLLTDADDFTRAFYREHGAASADAAPIPVRSRCCAKCACPAAVEQGAPAARSRTARCLPAPFPLTASTHHKSR